MQVNRRSGSNGYWLTVVLAMALSILPLPSAVDCFNPDWVLLVLIYWTLAMPEKIGIFNAWVLGLLVDVLTGRLLGLHALDYALISFLCITSHKRLRQHPVPQQSLFVFLFLLLSQVMVFWVESIQGRIELSVAFWFPVFTGTLFWPLIYSGLRFIRVFGRFD